VGPGARQKLARRPGAAAGDRRSHLDHRIRDGGHQASDRPIAQRVLRSPRPESPRTGLATFNPLLRATSDIACWPYTPVSPPLSFSEQPRLVSG
jgi:hypothetical protein